MTTPERVLALLDLVKPKALSDAKIGDVCAVGSHVLLSVLNRLEKSGAIISETEQTVIGKKTRYRISELA
jgi:hypothetical protein